MTRAPAMRRALQLIACSVALAFAAPVAASDFSDQLKKLLKKGGEQKAQSALGVEPPPGAVGAPLTLDEAVARVRRERPRDEIVGAATRDTPQGMVHEVRALAPNGKLRSFRFDAATGARRD